jgi:hypothetical protein
LKFFHTGPKPLEFRGTVTTTATQVDEEIALRAAELKETRQQKLQEKEAKKSKKDEEKKLQQEAFQVQAVRRPSNGRGTRCFL